MNKNLSQLLYPPPPPYIEPIYKSFLFDSDGNVNKIIVFNGLEDSNQFNPEKNKQYFTNSEAEEIDKKTIPIIWSSLKIHKDDSIKTIKEKIFYEIEKDTTWQQKSPLSTSHLYLFSHIKETIDLVELYQEITQNEKKPLKKEVFVQILANLNIEYENYENIEVTEYYDYEDFIKVFQSEQMNQIKITIPIGFQFSYYPRDYTFVANPYLIINASPDNERYSNTISNNPLKYDENGVLLNYGNIIDHNLYCCLYDEVVDFSFKTNIDKEYITELYFPVLSSTNIVVPPPSIKKKTAKEVPIKWRSVDSFYNLYMKTIEPVAPNGPGGVLVTPTPTSVDSFPPPSSYKIPYISYGIQKMTFKILSGATLTLPLENIFKNIHASAAIPYISFNPRVKKETILRLYSNKISKNGKKIPILKENEISKITKELKKTRAISFYFSPPSPSSTFLQKSGGVYKEIEIYMELCETGEIRLRCSHLSIPFSLNEWNTILYNVFTPLLTELNRILELFGYPLFKFQQLEDNENIIIENIKYVEIVKINKPIHLSNINGLSEIFTIIGNKETTRDTGTKTGIIDDIAKGVVMRFKRVNDFKENDEQTILITELFKKTRNTEVIIDVLKETFEMNELEAKTRLTNFIVEHNYELDDIRDSAGFPTLFQLNKLVSANNVLIITVDEINSLSYLNILHVYINCILQANLNPSLNQEELVGKKGWAVQLNKSAKVIVNQEMIEKAVKPSDEIVAKKAVAAIEFFEDDWIDDESETDLKEQEDMEGDMGLKEKNDTEFNEEENQGVEFKFKTDNSIMHPFPPNPLFNENKETTIKIKDNINNQKLLNTKEEESQQDSNIIMMEEDEETKEGSQPGSQLNSNSIIIMDENSDSENNNVIKSKEKSQTSSEPDDELIIMDENSDIESDIESNSGSDIESNSGSDEETKIKKNNKPTNTTTTTLPPSQKGGIIDPNLDGKPISILNRLQSHDPTLFISKKQGKYESYSRMCPSNIDRQPVSLTKEEKENIDKNHPNSYSKAIEYGTTDEKYWYICPRYWCLKTNTSITEEEVNTGKCGGIIPNNATKIPSGHYVYEFNSKTKQHLNPSGEYVNNNPGFLGTDSHPEGKCIPCCFKGSWDKPQQIKRRQECLQKPAVNTADEPTTNTIPTLATPFNAQKKGDVFYIINFLTYPIQPHRFGFLPLSVQKLFQMDITKMVLRSNSANIKPDTPCLLRYGVEYSSKQSFISCIAEIYAYKQELEVSPTVQEMKQIMVDTITIDDFVNYHNGSLISVFKDNTTPLPGTEDPRTPPAAPGPIPPAAPGPIPPAAPGPIPPAAPGPIPPAAPGPITPASFLSLKNTQLWKTTFKETDEPSENKIRNFLTGLIEEVGNENMFKLTFLKNILLSYQNFLSYLKNPDIEIDHTFLWDAVTDNHPQLIKDGINLIIIQIPNDDLTDNVEIICPTISASNKSYDFSNRETFILLKQDDFYEPVYLYEEKDKMIRLTKAFLEKSPVKPVIDTIQTIKSITKKYCSSQPSRPKVYHFKKNHEIKQTEKILKNNDYKIYLQLSNYQGKIIGLYISHRANRKSILKDATTTTAIPTEGVYIPIYPSSPLLSIPTKFADADDVYNDIYKNYETTLLRLRNIQRTTNGIMYVEPKIKVVEDGLVVGILTETNQYIQLSAPETLENTVAIDGPNPLVTLTGSSHLSADKTIATFQEGDKERVETIRNVSLESQFYLMFRSITRITLGKYQLTSIYIKKINQITNDPALLFKEKITSLVTVLKEMLKDKVDFKEMSDNIINKLDPLMKKAFTNEYSTYLIGSLKETKEIQQTGEIQQMGQSYGKLIVPKFNLVTGYDNEILYYTKLADELTRHTRIKLFMFHPRYFSIIPNQTYNINTNELLVLQSLLTHDYFKDIRIFNIAPQIRNTDYQFAEPAITELYSNKVTREEWMKLEAGEGGLIQNIEMNPCISSIRPVSGNWSREFVSNNKTNEIVFKNSVVCSYSPILYILQQKIQEGGTVTIDLIRKILWKGYNKYLTNYKTQILHVLKKEGKYDLVERIKKGAVTFETLVSSEDYYMTNLDYWVISLETNTPIILFNSTILKNITGEIDWLFLGGGKIYEQVNYIRSPALIEKNEPPRYSIIVPSFKYTNMKKMKEHIEGAIQGKPEFAKNTVSLTEYLSRISTKEMSTVVKKKIKIVDKVEGANEE